MGLYENIKDLAAQKNMSIASLERELKFSNGSISKWDKNSPSVEKIQKVADYLNISIDELIDYNPKGSLAEKYGAFAFDGKPVTDEEVEFLLSVLKAKRLTENK